jgi:hypothetical protein
MNLADLIDKVLPMALGAASVYAAIRADLARLHERATSAKDSADKAHDRIDSLLKDKK